MALPRLTLFVPVILPFNAPKPPGISRFFATCRAATHCPRFLKPEQALCRLPPGTATPLFARAFVNDVFSLLLLFKVVVGEWELTPLLPCPILPGPASMGRPALGEPIPAEPALPAPMLPAPAPAGRPMLPPPPLC